MTAFSNIPAPGFQEIEVEEIGGKFSLSSIPEFSCTGGKLFDLAARVSGIHKGCWAEDISEVLTVVSLS